MKVIDFTKYRKRHERYKLYKQVISIFILCLLLFQPANNSEGQAKGKYKKNDTARDNKNEIAKADTALSGALNILKELDKSIDKALKPKIIYKTRWRTKIDTVYVPVPDSLNIPDFNSYLQDQPDTVLIHDTIVLKVKERTWLRKQLDKL